MRNRTPCSVEQEEGNSLGGGLLKSTKICGKKVKCVMMTSQGALVGTALFMLLFLPTPATEWPLRPDQSSRESRAREPANSARRRSRLQRLTVRALYACPVPDKSQDSGKVKVCAPTRFARHLMFPALEQNMRWR
jgi:hypothetical protein